MLPEHDKTPRTPRVAYVVKRYPRFSETFIVQEILAHEAAGVEVEIFALRPPVDTHFQNLLSRVRASVTYLPDNDVRSSVFWQSLHTTGSQLPNVWAAQGDADTHAQTSLDVHQALVLAPQLIERGITHIHAHFATSATAVARLAAQFTGLPYSFTAHAKDIFHEEVCPQTLRRKLADAASVVTVSDFNRAYLQREFDNAADRVQRVYNGLDLSGFPYMAPNERPARIVAVGRLVEKKGFGVLIDACSLLAARGVAFETIIVGAGECEADLRERISANALDAYVDLLGPRPQSEVIRLMQSAAVFAAPCVEGSDGNRDGLPTVLLEAMALGTPCVSTDVTGIPELLSDEVTGLLVAQHDAYGLADALERLLADAALRVRLAERARARIEADFDIHRNAASMRRVIGVEPLPTPLATSQSHTSPPRPAALVAAASGTGA